MAVELCDGYQQELQSAGTRWASHSMKDLQHKALPITGENTCYFGTHLRNEFDSSILCVTCAKPGMEIVLERGGKPTFV
jgi:hypothetical protein